MRRVFGGVVVVLLAIGLVWLLYDSSEPVVDADELSPDASNSRMRAVPEAIAPRRLVEAPQIEPASAAVGHSKLAEVLGLVSTRCFVGTAYGSPALVGAYHQRIENGWYSNVETRLEGSRGVEQRFEYPEEEKFTDRYAFETLFRVHWKAEKPGDTVECTVERNRYAELTVVARDEGGHPVVGARAYGCGGGGTTDDEGRATFQVFANGAECSVRISTPFDPDEPGIIRADLDGVRPFEEHEQRTVALVLVDQPMQMPSYERPNELVPLVDGHASQADLFADLAAAAEGTEATLYKGLAEHRREMVQSEARREQRREDLHDLLDEMSAQAERGEAVDGEALSELIREMQVPMD